MIKLKSGNAKDKINELESIKPLKLKQENIEIRKNRSLVTFGATLSSITCICRDTKFF